MESLGYTDKVIAEELGFPHARALGEYIFAQLGFVPDPDAQPVMPRDRPDLWGEAIFFVREFSRSFVYALPLMVLLWLGDDTNYRWLSPDLASLLTLATLGSLITTGGFVQVMFRRGSFYLSLRGKAQLLSSARLFVGLGVVVSALLGMMMLWLGFYGGVTQDINLVVAVIYYVLLSWLWLLFGLLSIEWVWVSPVGLLGLTALFLVLKPLWDVSALEAMVGGMGITLVGVLGLALIWWWRLRRQLKPEELQQPLPSLSAMLYLLGPYFGYGFFYFVFMFTDRLVAGFQVAPQAGLFFAIQSDYQRSIDGALLGFLLLAPFLEYANGILVRYWFKFSKYMVNSRKLSRQLRRRYLVYTAAIALIFCLLVALTYYFLQPWKHGDYGITLLGSLGYFCFSLGLLNCVLLFSLDHPQVGVRSLMLGVASNLLIGAIVGIFFASGPVWGLLGGAIIFWIVSLQRVWYLLGRPDFAYYRGGY